MNDALKTEITQTLPLLHGWCQLEKALHLASLVLDGLKTAYPVVEIGVFGGQSLIPMALALRHTKYFALGIDPMTSEAATEGDVGKENADWWANKVNLDEIHAGFVQSVLDLKLTRHCRWIRMRSEQCVNLFPDGSIGLLHLDSNHSEEVSCRDVFLWESKVAVDGQLVFDDSNWPSQSKAREMLEQRFKLIGDFPNGQGQQYAVFYKTLQ